MPFLLMFIAYTPTPEFWALCTLIVGGLGKFIWDQAKRYNDRKDAAAAREQARIDAAEARRLAKEDLQELLDITTKGFEVVKENGNIRLKAIIQSNVTTRQFAKNAIVESNGIKKSLIENGVKLIETTTESNHEQASQLH